MKSNYKPLIVAVFLVVAGLVLRIYSFSDFEANTVQIASTPLIGVAEGAQMADSSALTQNMSAMIGASNDPVMAGINSDGYVDTATVQDPGQPIGPTMNSSAAIQYTVKKGDTLSGIAVKFHTSAASIVSANPNIRKKALQVGMSITIPGVGGNASTSMPTLPNLNGDFIMPAQGYNEAVLQSDNSVLIENSCGTPVVAAADGVVVPDKNIVNTAGGWNDGYGTFILIEHPFGNGVFTRYAQLQQTLVSVGDFVKQGQEIGLMGQTGGANACSLSFQVIGAQNPFGK
jgi:LysM repeat protein